MNQNISTPTPQHLADYLHYQYPATTGDIALNHLCETIARYEKENTILRGLLPKMAVNCPYCELNNMGLCKSGFPGCAWADDLMCGEDECFRRLLEDKRQAEAALRLTRQTLQDIINSCVHPDKAYCAVMVNLKPVRAALATTLKQAGDTMTQLVQDMLAVIKKNLNTSDSRALVDKIKKMFPEL